MAAAGWVALAASCEQARTELVARVDSEVPWGAGASVQSVSLTVRRGGPTGPLRSARTTTLGVGGERRPLPLLVGVLPGDDTDTPVWIEVLGCGDPNGCTASTAVVAQRAVVRFSRGQTEEVPLLLASACVGVGGRCQSDERCGMDGRCEPATRAPVRPFDGTDAGALADVAMDVSRVDATAARDVSPPYDLTAADLPQLVDAPAVDLPTGDGAASCGASEVRCAGACVAALRDPMNCGACGRVCPPSQSCEAGSCVALTCPAGMRLIPSGAFSMGDADPRSIGAQPPHMVTLSAFCMDLTEVTVAAYRACPASTCPPPGSGEDCNWPESGRDSHPINCVDRAQSRAYCQSVGGDLPTEAQWEYAARGTDGRMYPWGDDAPLSRVCWRDGMSAPNGTCPVGLFPSGRSPFGLFDMAGNVMEWTLDWYGPYPAAAVVNPTGPDAGTQGIVRGGAWTQTRLSAAAVRTAFRSGVDPANPSLNVGFRCAHAPLR